MNIFKQIKQQGTEADKLRSLARFLRLVKNEYGFLIFDKNRYADPDIIERLHEQHIQGIHRQARQQEQAANGQHRRNGHEK